MKMDKIAFARLIGYLTNAGLYASPLVIEDIDSLIDIKVPVPVPAPAKASCADVDALLIAIKAGEKIPTIKAYRTLTGAGLKESKDAVEAHIFFPPRYSFDVD